MGKRQNNQDPYSEEAMAARMTDVIKVDVDSIPEHVKDSLAEAILQGFREFMKKPGSRELLDKRSALKKASRSIIDTSNSSSI